MELIAIKGGDCVMDVGRIRGEDPGEKIVCPIMSFVVVTGEHVVLFDTGMNPQVRDNAVNYWGRVANRVIVPHLPPGEDILQRLRDVGYPPESITLVVNSHLHNDHAGTNLEYPNARILVRRPEWEHALTLMDEPSSGYVRDDFHDENNPPDLFDYEESYDLLGDGRVQLISTAGHTPGHQSLLVTFTSGRRFVMTGDAAYREADLQDRCAPAIAWKPELAAASSARLGALRDSGATVLVCHDEPTWHDIKDFGVLHSEED
jgi:N-acyl homoserine lactone hydrolase